MIEHDKVLREAIGDAVKRGVPIDAYPDAPPIGAQSPPTEIELLGEMVRCMGQMPSEGRWAALRYLRDRFAADMPPQMF